jgi:hypothetical protein
MSMAKIILRRIEAHPPPFQHKVVVLQSPEAFQNGCRVLRGFKLEKEPATPKM